MRDFQHGLDRESSFRVLFERYYRPLKGYFRRKGESRDDSLDLVQETFLRVYKGLERFRGDADFGTWVFRIAHNLYLNRHRTAANRAVIEVPLAPTGTGAEAGPALFDREPASQELSAAEALEKTERIELVRKAIGGLPEQMQQCVKLRVLQDLKYREIALVMHLSIGTVKAHLAQARAKLGAELAPHFQKDDLGL